MEALRSELLVLRERERQHEKVEYLVAYLHLSPAANDFLFAPSFDLSKRKSTNEKSGPYKLLFVYSRTMAILNL